MTKIDFGWWEEGQVGLLSLAQDFSLLSLSKASGQVLLAYLVTRGKGSGQNFSKNNITQGHNIKQSESNGSKMADRLTLIRP